MDNMKINGVLNVGTPAANMNNHTTNVNDYKITNITERARPDEEIIKTLKEYRNYAKAIRDDLMESINDANETLLNDTPYSLAFIDDKSVEIEITNDETHEMRLVEDEFKDLIPKSVWMIRDLVSGYTFQMIQEYENKQRDLVINALRDKYKTIARGIITAHVGHLERLKKDYVEIFTILSCIYEDFRPIYNTRNLNSGEIGKYEYDLGKITPAPLMVPTCETTSVDKPNPSISTRNLDSNSARKLD